ncbi:MAG: amidase [Candidatus Rokubacteria bacterium]|nr:amidase [Candidatus Rokubacteria bacterium]
MTDWTIGALAAAVAARRVSPVEVTQECLARIGRLDPTLRGFITLDADGALREAKSLEEEAMAGRLRGPLHGVPMAWKDLCYVPGLPTSCGTRTPEYFVDERECEAVRRLRRAGAVGLGKLNMTELALGPFGDNPHHGDAQNPWKAGHVAGGSSSGAGVAVAAGLVLGAVGSDTGGSIRLPAACCGIVGLKPTYGRVSRAGTMPLSWSLDHLGPMTRTVADTALMLGAMAGQDATDATSSRRPVPDYAAALGRGIAGLRVGVPENHYFDGVTAETGRGVREAADVLRRLGATVLELCVPDPQPMIDVASTMTWCESSALHARVARERPHELGRVARTRLEFGFHVSAFDYLQASRMRARLTREFLREVFAQVDVLVTPTIPEPAPALADVTAGPVDEVVRRMGRFSRLTRPWNGLGLPALSLPCGFSAAGPPVALQVAGRPFDEATVLRVGHAYEQATEWSKRRPEV